RQRQHLSPTPRVEKAADEQRPEKVRCCERQNVPSQLIHWDAVERRQDEGIGEEDGVVEVGLRDHQREPDQRTLPIHLEYRVCDLSQRRMRARSKPLRDELSHINRMTLAAQPILDARNDGVRLCDPAVRNEPSRALRNPPAHEKYHPTQDGADDERRAPADVGREQGRVEQDDRCKGADRGAEPEAAVYDEIGPAADTSRDQFLDRRVDGRVLATYAGSGEEAEHDEAPEIP